MKKYIRAKSTFLNQEGIVFPWVLFLSFLLLIITLLSIHQYENHLLLLKSHQSSVTLQHIIDTSRRDLEQELTALPETQKHHAFKNITPDGEAIVDCSHDDQWICTWNVTEYSSHSHKQIKTSFHP
ncbi:hypothetical protein SAMN05192559_102275 [Halobacillus karajensis]|nr:hypothetical protein SAMN05192559_102275 [Halobacillus karajensis]